MSESSCALAQISFRAGGSLLSKPPTPLSGGAQRLAVFEPLQQRALRIEEPFAYVDRGHLAALQRFVGVVQAEARELYRFARRQRNAVLDLGVFTGPWSTSGEAPLKTCVGGLELEPIGTETQSVAFVTA